jgi:hypothetical protein
MLPLTDLSYFRSMRSLFATTLLGLLLYPPTAFNQWSYDPTVNTPVCITSGDQLYPSLVTDGAGGAIITWLDFRSGQPAVYLQRLNAEGVAQWAVNGIPIYEQPEPQDAAGLVSDGVGGAIVCWRDRRGGTIFVYGQRVAPNGAVLWTQTGVPIFQGESGFCLTSDGAGGCIVSWEESRNNNSDLFAQKLDSSGQTQWPSGGVVVCADTSTQRGPAITSDEFGGAIVGWLDNRNGQDDVFVQRISREGSTLWTTGGVRVSYTYDVSHPLFTGDGLGGVIATWFVQTPWGDNGIVAQHISPDDGRLMWDTLGIFVIATDRPLWHISQTSDGEGGAFVLSRYSTPGGMSVLVDRVEGGQGGAVLEGSLLYSDICPDGIEGAVEGGQGVANASILYADICSDGIGGAFVAATCGVYPIPEPNCQVLGWHRNHDNAPLWPTVLISTTTDISTPTEKSRCRVVSDGLGGAIFIWEDLRNANRDIYAQHVSSDGTLPAQVLGFTAEIAGPSSVALTWSTVSETNNYGFVVEKDTARTQQMFTEIPGSFTQGQGTTIVPQTYTFIDTHVKPGKWAYRLKQIDLDGTLHVFEPRMVDLTTTGAENKHEVPTASALQQNYPNPFNPSTV